MTTNATLTIHDPDVIKELVPGDAADLVGRVLELGAGHPTQPPTGWQVQRARLAIVDTETGATALVLDLNTMSEAPWDGTTPRVA